MAITVITTRSSMSVKPSRLRHTEYLLDRGDASLDLPPAVLPQGCHPLRLRDLPQRAGTRALEKGLLDLVGEDQEFEETGPTAIARMPARRAAVPPLELEAAHGLLREERHGARVWRVPLAALGTDLPHEALGQDALERGRDQIRLDLEIHEPGHRARCIVRMKRREDEMPSERGLHRGGRRLAIAHFADHE